MIVDVRMNATAEVTFYWMEITTGGVGFYIFIQTWN